MSVCERVPALLVSFRLKGEKKVTIDRFCGLLGCWKIAESAIVMSQLTISGLGAISSKIGREVISAKVLLCLCYLNEQRKRMSCWTVPLTLLMGLAAGHFLVTM